MILMLRVSSLLFTLFFVKSEIYLYHTNDAQAIEYYDCVLVQPSLYYCRRPREAIALFRDNDTRSCQDNNGKLHRFSELRSKRITVSTILHQWKSSLERVEQYSRYLTDSSQSDGYLCECFGPVSFGKNCEYRIPTGKIFAEALDWQLMMRKENPWEVQAYGDIICYETLQCDSGVLCLDWREICDGIQNCMSGLDEENCDLLEMSICEYDEYRCMNGMCIPDQFFLDGELDCLDWSDELRYKQSDACPINSVSTECDDHLCLPNEWSCGDGQCIADRLPYLKLTSSSACQSERDQYFICETRRTNRQWTMPNGRCYGIRNRTIYDGSAVASHSEEERCKYLLKCVLTQREQTSCSCDHGCIEQLKQACFLSLIQYPRGAIVAPFLFFLFNATKDLRGSSPDLVLINGTVRCGSLLINVTKTIPFGINLDARRVIEEHFCRPFRDVSSLQSGQSRRECHHSNESTNRCNEWNPCMSITRIKDGWNNCLDKIDESEQTAIEIETSCARIRRHRFHCSIEQPTCLSVTKLGYLLSNCKNGFDYLWFGDSKKLSEMNCNDQKKDECSLLRRYIDQSGLSMNESAMTSKLRIPFRSNCDTFWDLHSGEDENLLECQRSWICPRDQWRCQTGQCYEQRWGSDDEWDCADASDEHNWLNLSRESILKGASSYDFTNHSYFIPSSCNQSALFLCPAYQATRQGFSCFNLSQIGDGQVDCAGAMDERNVLKRCSQSSMLGLNFWCSSSDTCIPYYLHCSDGNRCPNRSDDEHWCSRQNRPYDCSDRSDFICFDGQCAKGGRCDTLYNCPFAEDEYMCDFRSLVGSTTAPYREEKRSAQRAKKHTIRLSTYPSDAKITRFNRSSMTSQSPRNLSKNGSSLSAYWCNRGLGVLLRNNSIVCFCPPQYYGEKCEYHADRLSVLLYLNFSQSIYSDGNDPMTVLKVLVLFLLNDRTLMSEKFHPQPAKEINILDKKKLIAHFPYPHSASSRQQRRNRFFNRSDILNLHPNSIRIELYRTARIAEQPSLIAVWKYPIDFDHLPVYRLAKVLYLSESSAGKNPCFSQPCHRNELCQPLMNDKSQYICLCPTNFAGENCSAKDQNCLSGYCATGSLCQPNSGASLPYCLCPMNRYGDQCLIEHDRCLSNPCLNGGSCVTDSQPDQVICICTKGYIGPRCQSRRPSIHLSLATGLLYQGTLVQFLQIDLISLHLVPLDQQVFTTLPEQVDYYHYDQKTSIPDIAVVKLYSSFEDSMPDLHLLSVHLDLFSFVGRTEISQINRCSQLRTFSNESSPIRYHQICIADPALLCFRDDTYLCICGENHTRVECFLYDNQVDRCSHCLVGGLCLKGNSRRSDDFICLCPPCYSGPRCQLNTKSFDFTLHELFFPDLLPDQRQTTISLLVFFHLLGFFLAIPSNLFSFVTLRRRSCLRHGVGHYLLWMSVVNQLSLAILNANLIHLIVIMTTVRSSPVVDDIFCKLLTYLLTCVTRLEYWLPSFVALERAYTTVFFNQQWFKQPHIARRLMLATTGLVLLTAADELAFVKALPSIGNGNTAMCITEYPIDQRLQWMFIQQVIAVSHFLLPLLINLCSTLTIMSIVIKSKMNVRGTEMSDKTNGHGRRTAFRTVLNENREMITRPAITLVPSISSLFSLAFYVTSFSLVCQNLENNPLRYLLITFYFVTVIPQTVMFYLYIYPSSFYWKQWQATSIGRRITTFRQHQSPENVMAFSTIHQPKTGNLPSETKND